MRPSCAAESPIDCPRGYSKYDTLSNPARRTYAASANRLARLPPKPWIRMTGSLAGAEKYGSPLLTSQSSGYEPINAPAAAISAITVLEFTISHLRASHLNFNANHGVSPRQPASAGVCASACDRRTMPKRDAPTISSMPRRHIEVTVMSEAKRQSKGPAG